MMERLYLYNKMMITAPYNIYIETWGCLMNTIGISLYLMIKVCKMISSSLAQYPSPLSQQGVSLLLVSGNDNCD